MMKDNGTYCQKIFNEIYTHQNKRISFMLSRINKLKPQKYKSQTHKPFEYFNSPEMEDKRDKVLSGIKLDECVTCYKQEETNPE